jgi:GT2 family glycosyltransferase/O-antigen/teichoic acid export membrane protein
VEGALSHSAVPVSEGAPLSASVVVCVYTERRWDLFLQALRSLSGQTRLPDQVIVVVDHNDDLLDRARAALPPTVQVVPNTEASGLAGARNTGVALATGDIVAFLDDDAEAEPDWLEELVRHYDEDRVVGTSGWVRAEWPDDRRPRWLPPEFDWVVGCSYRGLPDSVAPVRNPIGASMSMRHRVFDVAGGFDTAMGRMGTTPLGCEETELAVRARQRMPEAEFLHVPASVVRHHVSIDRTKLRYFTHRCYAEGLSKAALAHRRGAAPALASERSYVARTLPRGVVAGLTDTLRGDLAGVVRALVIVLGVLVTTGGYAIGRVRGFRLRSATGQAVAGVGQERRNLFVTLAYMAGQQGLAAFLGFLFWVFAARFFPPGEVGVAFAASNTALLLATVGILGIPTVLIAEFRSIDPPERRTILSTALVVSGVAVGLLGLIVLMVSHYLGKSLAVIGGNPAIAGFFVLGSVAAAVTSSFDSAAIAIRRGPAQLARGILGQGLKIAIVGLLIAFGLRSTSALVFAWAAGTGASLFLCYRMLQLPPGRTGWAPRARVAVAQRYGRLALNHQVLTLSFKSVGYLVPVIAALVTASRQYAYFATANTVAWAALMLSWLLALSLFAETTKDEEALSRQIRRTFPLGIVASLAVVAVIEVAAPLVLRLFGPAYAAHSESLRLLILLGPFYVVKDHYAAIRRATGQLTLASRVMLAGTVAEVVGATVGGVLGGIPMLCTGWVVAAAVEAFVLLPAIVQVYRRRDQGPADTDAGRLAVTEAV